MVRQTCPDRNDLRAYSLGTLEPESADSLEDHLAECTRCRDGLESFEALADELVLGLRGAGAVESLDSEPEIERLMRELRSRRKLQTTRVGDGFDESDRGFVLADAPHDRRARSSPPAGNKRLSTQPVPETIEDLTTCLIQSGLFSQEELRAILDEIANSPRANDALTLARRLVERQHLTCFQATEVCHGRVDTLLLGDYVLVDEIGRGGMGRVYKAHHLRMDRHAAVKILAPHLFDEPGSVERFRRETRAIARVSHPHVVTAYDARAHADTQYLVMEFIDGTTLTSLVQSQGPLSPGQTVECLRQAARGLAAAHAQGVIHRDVKPSNLLISHDGVVKVTDLGLARFLIAGDGDDDLTETGQILGTLDYISPEQAHDLGVADERSDVYSLGWTLFHLLTGEAPFAGESRLGKLIAHRDAPIPSLTDRLPDVPPELDRLFQRMVSKQPDDRPTTMQEVVTAFEQMPRDPSDPWPPTIPPAENAIDLDAFFDDLRQATQQAAKQRSEERQQEVSRRRKRQSVIAAAVLPILVALTMGAYTLVVRATTPEGELVVKITDANPDQLDIRVRQGEKHVTILDARSGWSIQLPKGTYSLSLGKGNGQFRLDRNVVKVRPNAQQTIEVEIRPRPTAETPTSQAAPEAPESDRLYGEVARIKLCDRILMMTLSPDKKIAYALGHDMLIYVVDLTTRKVVRRLNQDQMPLTSLAVSHDGQRLATCTGEQTIRIWDVKTGKPALQIKLPVSPKDAIFSPDDETLLASMWAAGSKVPRPLPGENGREFRSLMRFDSRTGKPLKPITDQQGEVYHAIDVSPDGTLIAWGNAAGEVAVIDAETGKERYRFTGNQRPPPAISTTAHRGPIHAVRFSDDGKRLYSVGNANFLFARSLDDGRIVFTRRFRSGVIDFDFTPDETLFLLHGGFAVRVFDRRNPALQARIDIPGHTSSIKGLRLLADPRYAVSVSWDGTLRIWKLPPRDLPAAE